MNVQNYHFSLLQKDSHLPAHLYEITKLFFVLFLKKVYMCKCFETNDAESRVGRSKFSIKVGGEIVVITAIYKVKILL